MTCPRSVPDTHHRREAAPAPLEPDGDPLGAVDHQSLESFAPGLSLLGLVASAALRCNDCIDYHLEQCVKAGSTKEEIEDALNVALVVGGSIFIPHMRHALLSLDELLAERGRAQ